MSCLKAKARWVAGVDYGHPSGLITTHRFVHTEMVNNVKSEVLNCVIAE